MRNRRSKLAWLLGAGCVLVFWVGLRFVLFTGYTVLSGSMTPTLESGEHVLFSRVGTVDRGDVVTVQKPGEARPSRVRLIQRVIGLSGETLELRDGNVYIDGALLAESYVLEADSSSPRLLIPGCAGEEVAVDRCTIPEGHVFVMGDNRRGSSDSRVFGPIPGADITGQHAQPFWWPFGF